MTRQAAREWKKLQKELPYPFGHAIDDADVWEAVYGFGLEWATRKQIADALGRSVHPALVNRIERLVSEGKIEREVFTLRNNAQGYRYRALET